MLGTFTQTFRAGTRPRILTDPTTLVNLNIWYNADISNNTNFGTAPANGDPVTSWNDRSGTGHAANQSGNSSVKPTWRSNVQNGYGILRFDGTAQSLNINPVAFMVSLSGFTLMLVARASSLSGTRTLTSSDQNGLRIAHNGTNWFVQTSSGTGTSTVAGDTNKFHIFTLIFDGSAADNSGRLKFRYDKVDQALTYTGTVGSTTSAAAKTFYVCTDSTGGANFFGGDVGEMLMWTRTLNSSEIVNAEAYLKYHWAL